MTEVQLAQTTFQEMIQKTPRLNNHVLIIDFITRVVEKTASLLKKSTGKKMTGMEKLSLCKDISEYCVNQLRDKNLISAEQYQEVMSVMTDIDVYANLISGIISLAKTHCKCC